MNSIIEELNIPIVPIEDIPSNFAALTRPIRADQQDTIRSIWSTLVGTNALCTYYRDPTKIEPIMVVIFWRPRTKRKRHTRVGEKFCVYNGRGKG